MNDEPKILKCFWCDNEEVEDYGWKESPIKTSKYGNGISEDMLARRQFHCKNCGTYEFSSMSLRSDLPANLRRDKVHLSRLLKEINEANQQEKIFCIMLLDYQHILPHINDLVEQ